MSFSLCVPQSILILAIGLMFSSSLFAQDRYELNSNWKMASASSVKESGEQISLSNYSLENWKPAIVPGTVLTSMLANKEVPDPFWGMNNERIPDIYNIGREYYTYWFLKDFKEVAPDAGKHIWLTFRGINYSVDIFLNGKKVNHEPFKGMFLRKSFDITKLLSKTGNNRLAVIVHPPDHVGNPNGGQGGDGEIARGVGHQYVAGWDWIRPIRDRNTGIWDKVYIERTSSVNLKDPHIVTLVPGKRQVEGKQADAILKVSADLQNTSGRTVGGVLQYTFNGKKVSKQVVLPAAKITTVALPNFIISDPELWWPAGYGPQHMYNIKVEFLENGKTISDSENIRFGVREIQTDWNDITRSKQIYVNGQKIFIKGGNWIISDAMLRFSPERYNAEIRYHRDMNLNLIRIWGGALTERPEFYQACDDYGMLVMQDFWMSGDCNGRWVDPMKKEDQWTRRNYPDDHSLFLESAADMVKMIRNHPSLAMWCGGNEITPPQDILIPLKDSILAKLDGTRWFTEYSNSDEMSYNQLGGNGDGPYSVQNISTFWDQRTWPFNSEVGSVGVGDYESLARFMPKENMRVPVPKPGQNPNEDADSVWTYHTYTGVGYESSLLPYGKPKDIKDFTDKAQLVNYDQYRALIEGFSSHMWEWYTGVMIWKTQNPWTAMRGQMYDYYLDPNACLFGLRTGSRMLHAMCNPTDKMISVVNNDTKPHRDLMLSVKAYDIAGNEKQITQVFAYMEPSSVKKIMSVKKIIEDMASEHGAFLHLQLLDVNKNVLDDNFYWYPNEKGEYTGLNNIKSADLKVAVSRLQNGKIKVRLTNPVGNPVAFFNRISVVDVTTGERILPAFYDDNYVSVVPGAERIIEVDCPTLGKSKALGIIVRGWNGKEQRLTINN